MKETKWKLHAFHSFCSIIRTSKISHKKFPQRFLAKCTLWIHCTSVFLLRTKKQNKTNQNYKQTWIGRKKLLDQNKRLKKKSQANGIDLHFIFPFASNSVRVINIPNTFNSQMALCIANADLHIKSPGKSNTSSHPVLCDHSTNADEIETFVVWNCFKHTIQLK